MFEMCALQRLSLGYPFLGNRLLKNLGIFCDMRSAEVLWLFLGYCWSMGLPSKWGVEIHQVSDFFRVLKKQFTGIALISEIFCKKISITPNLWKRIFQSLHHFTHTIASNHRPDIVFQHVFLDSYNRLYHSTKCPFGNPKRASNQGDSESSAS